MMRFRLYSIMFVSALAACGRETPPAPAEPLADYRSPGAEDAGFVPEDPRLQALVGRAAPALRLQTVDGGSIDLTEIYGRKPVYLKLWATYCIPCREQMPAFEQLAENLGDRVAVIAVNAGFGDDAAKVRAFAQRHGLTMPQAIDDGRLGNWLGLRATPLHLLIGRDGRVRYAGHQDGPALDAALRALLADQSSDASPAVAPVADVTPLRVGDPVPELHLTQPDGTALTVKVAADGQPQALLFTASWCESYLAEIEPQTVADCRRFREAVAQAQAPIAWLGVLSHLWTAPGDVAAYAGESDLAIPFALDADGSVFARFGVRDFPVIALIGADGRLQQMIGPDEADPAAALAAFAQAQSR